MTGRFGKPDSTGRSSGKVGGRRGKAQKPPAGEPWCWLTREMLASQAWRSLSINARRFMDFLLIEHMNHAGTENGGLKATYQQLEQFGLHANKISAAIVDCEKAGLIASERGGMRVATTYTLTWLPSRHDTPASNKWKQFKVQKSTRTSEGNKPAQVRAEGTNLPAQVRADSTPISAGPSISRRGSSEKTSLPDQATAAQQKVGTKKNSPSLVDAFSGRDGPSDELSDHQVEQPIEMKDQVNLPSRSPSRLPTTSHLKGAQPAKDPYRAVMRRIQSISRVDETQAGLFILEHPELCDQEAAGRLTDAVLIEAIRRLP